MAGLTKEGGGGVGGGGGKGGGEAEERGPMSQVRNEEESRKTFGSHNQRESIEERLGGQGGGDFSRPSGFLAMPSATSAQVPL